MDFYDPSPVKEELRNKIITRLLREGSSADEPSNIALSDYSSLSSGCESSTDEDEANKGKHVLKKVCLKMNKLFQIKPYDFLKIVCNSNN